MTEIVLATGNPHKVEELRAILGPLLPKEVWLLGLREAFRGPIPEPAETGETFEANAALKARYYAKVTSRWCLADDSGLEIDALGGKPGVISSHYSTDGQETGLTREARDAANNARVMRELDGIPPERRTARFVCVTVLAHGDNVLASGKGAFEGRIGLPGQVPRGGEGFGYDPLFLVAPEFARTSAELSRPHKNSLSHRGGAARDIAAKIAGLLKPA